MYPPVFFVLTLNLSNARIYHIRAPLFLIASSGRASPCQYISFFFHVYMTTSEHAGTPRRAGTRLPWTMDHLSPSSIDVGAVGSVSQFTLAGWFVRQGLMLMTKEYSNSWYAVLILGMSHTRLVNWYQYWIPTSSLVYIYIYVWLVSM